MNTRKSVICGVAALTLSLGWPSTSHAQRGGGGGGRGGGGGGGSGGAMSRGAPSSGGNFSGGRSQGVFNGNNGNRQSFNNGSWSGQGRNNWNGGNNNWNGNNWNGNYWNGNRYGWGYPGGLGIAIGLGLGGRGYGYGGYGGYGGYTSGDYYAADYPSYYVAPAVNGTAVQAIPEATPIPPADNVQQTTAQGTQESNTAAATAYFNEAVNAFRNGDYRAALRSAAHAAIDDPKNAKPHELASLALFASREYRGAAIEAHVALALAPASNWDTMVGYYGGVNEQFTTQLRALEAYSTQNPTAGEAHFLLGYLYQGMGYSEQAKTHFAEAARLTPKDEIAHKFAGTKVETAIKIPEPKQETSVPKSEISAPTENEVTPPVVNPDRTKVPPAPIPPTSNPQGQ